MTQLNPKNRGHEMNATAIKIDERFSELELAEMFNVECGRLDDGQLTDVEGTSEPLWTIQKREQPRDRSRGRRVGTDHIRDGITEAAAGTADRVAALAAFYAAHENDELSAFEN